MSLHQLTASLFILLSFSSPFGFCKQPLVFTNQFAIHVPAGKEQADAIAEKHGFVNIGQGLGSKINLAQKHARSMKLGIAIFRGERKLKLDLGAFII
ncbi:unnamed protein product [Nezara viridula]|uniref:Peptidase S8 pro-domain domain-containing protein n=1 Tax=Nezara viridula TaxID=85310 RepID=A0A9P0HIJ9_NEZVI|nr:unnamed protein product [Nezara viridula]